MLFMLVCSMSQYDWCVTAVMLLHLEPLAGFPMGRFHAGERLLNCTCALSWGVGMSQAFRKCPSRRGWNSRVARPWAKSWAWHSETSSLWASRLSVDLREKAGDQFEIQAPGLILIDFDRCKY